MFDKDSSLPTDDVNSRSNIWDVAIDVKDNFFLLTALEKPGTEKSCWVKRLAKTADLYYRFCLKEEVDCIRLSEGILKNPRDITVANEGRVMVVDTEDSCVHTSVNTATV